MKRTTERDGGGSSSNLHSQTIRANTGGTLARVRWRGSLLVSVQVVQLAELLAVVLAAWVDNWLDLPLMRQRNDDKKYAQ